MDRRLESEGSGLRNTSLTARTNISALNTNSQKLGHKTSRAGDVKKNLSQLRTKIKSIDFTFHSLTDRFQEQSFTNPVAHRNTIDDRGAEMPKLKSKRKLNSRNKTQYIGDLEFDGMSTLIMANNDSMVNRSLGENSEASQPQFEDSHASISK